MLAGVVGDGDQKRNTFFSPALQSLQLCDSQVVSQPSSTTRQWTAEQETGRNMEAVEEEGGVCVSLVGELKHSQKI